MGVPRIQVDEAAEAVVDAYRSYELIQRGCRTERDQLVLQRAPLSGLAREDGGPAPRVTRRHRTSRLRRPRGRSAAHRSDAHERRGAADLHPVLVRDRGHGN